MIWLSANVAIHRKYKVCLRIQFIFIVKHIFLEDMLIFKCIILSINFFALTCIYLYSLVGNKKFSN